MNHFPETTAALRRLARVVADLFKSPSQRYAEMLKEGDDAGTERMVVKRGKSWVFWTASDRTEPLRKAIENGWKPGDGSSIRGQ